MPSRLMIAVAALLVAMPAAAQPAVGPGRAPRDIEISGGLSVLGAPHAAMAGQHLVVVWVQQGNRGHELRAARLDPATLENLDPQGVPIAAVSSRTYFSVVNDGTAARLFFDAGTGALTTARLDPALPELLDGCPEAIDVDYTAMNGFRIAAAPGGFRAVWTEGSDPGVVLTVGLGPDGATAGEVSSTRLDETGVVLGDWVAAAGGHVLSWSNLPDDGGSTRSGLSRWGGGSFVDGAVLSERPFVRGRGTVSAATLAAADGRLLAIWPDHDDGERLLAGATVRWPVGEAARVTAFAAASDGVAGFSPTVQAVEGGWLVAYRPEADDPALLRVVELPAEPPSLPVAGLELSEVIQGDNGVGAARLVTGAGPVLLQTDGGLIRARAISPAGADGIPSSREASVVAGRPSSRGAIGVTDSGVVAAWPAAADVVCLGQLDETGVACTAARPLVLRGSPSLLRVGSGLLFSAVVAGPDGDALFSAPIDAQDLTSWPTAEAAFLPTQSDVSHAHVEGPDGWTGARAFLQAGGRLVVAVDSPLGSDLIEVVERDAVQAQIFAAADGFLLVWTHGEQRLAAHLQTDLTLSQPVPFDASPLNRLTDRSDDTPAAVAGTPTGLMLADLPDNLCSPADDEGCEWLPGELLLADRDGLVTERQEIAAREGTGDSSVLLWQDGPVLLTIISGSLWRWTQAGGWEQTGATGAFNRLVAAVAVDAKTIALQLHVWHAGPQGGLNFRFTTSAGEDGDGDGVPDLVDNCAAVSNVDQADADGDGYGNDCDLCANDADDRLVADGVCLVDALCAEALDPPPVGDRPDDPVPGPDDGGLTVTSTGGEDCGCELTSSPALGWSSLAALLVLVAALRRPAGRRL